MLNRASKIAKKPNSAKIKAFKVAEFASAKKAKNAVILDVRAASHLCDYFVVCSGASARQVKAIYEEVLKRCREAGLAVHHSEDDQLHRWVLIDLSDVILHVFAEEARGFYNLEYLWKQAKRVKPPRARLKK